MANHSPLIPSDAIPKISAHNKINRVLDTHLQPLLSTPTPHLTLCHVPFNGANGRLLHGVSYQLPIQHGQGLTGGQHTLGLEGGLVDRGDVHLGGRCIEALQQVWQEV